jgi:hypothetical protein
LLLKEWAEIFFPVKVFLTFPCPFKYSVLILTCKDYANLWLMGRDFWKQQLKCSLQSKK